LIRHKEELQGVKIYKHEIKTNSVIFYIEIPNKFYKEEENGIRL